MPRTVHYICKYTPVELIEALGGEPVAFDLMPDGFERAEEVAHPNLCGFGKAIIEAVLAGEVRELVLVNCCDTIRSVYDILKADGRLDYLAEIDMLRAGDACSCGRVAAELSAFARDFAAAHGTAFDPTAFRRAFAARGSVAGPHIAVLGARMGSGLFDLVEQAMPLPVENLTCVHGRTVGAAEPPDTDDLNELLSWYAAELLRQAPCMRMTDTAARRALFEDPNLAGVVYHTIKFCDFYGFEYADVKERLDVPMLKIESDYTTQSSGQLVTRLEAFAESLGMRKMKTKTAPTRTVSADDRADGAKPKEALAGSSARGNGKTYFAGIDSGSTSTDVVILNERREIVCGTIVPTGAGAAAGAERALGQALAEAGIERDDIAAIVATGYGREAIDVGGKSITEITCHARGAHFLDPSVRTVIDIGGQDSKAIVLAEDGSVENFAMNDKCAAGTGRFLEMMARTLEMGLDELSQAGLSHREDVTISSMCTVFAESEIVSLIAQNKATDDIVHGLNKAVASKTAALAKRVGGHGPYMMTGGVSKNAGLVKALEERLGESLVISEHAQLNGALGAALYAADQAGA